MDDDIAIFETVTLKDDLLINYETAIYELNFTGSVLKLDDKIEMTRIRSGRTRIKSIPWQENIIVAPMLPQFIKGN